MRFTFRRLLLGVLLLVLAVVGWFGWQAFQVYQGITHFTGRSISFVSNEPTVTIPSLSNQRYNILVLGSDNDKKLEEKHPLTQSMIVVSIDPVHDQVTLFSIPRDFWVKIPGYGYDKIFTAAKRGKTLSSGIALARATVHEVFGIPIHFYAWVGLDGFRNVIDTFNGVTLDVNHPIFDDFYPDDTRPGDPYAYTRVFIPAGWRHLSGRQALEYVRSRHGDSNGDFSRSARQQQLLLALRKKVSAFNVITNLPSLVNDLQDAVQTDLTIPQLFDLAQLSRHIQEGNIHRVVLQAPYYCDYGWRTQNGLRVSVLIPNWSRIRPLVKQVFAPISVAPPTTPPAKQKSGPPPPPAKSGVTATARPAATAAPTPAAPTLAALPGRLILEKNGNVFQLSRDRSLTQVTRCNAEAMPELSPNGKTLAYIRFSTNYSTDIWLSHPGHNDCPWNADGAHSWHLQLTQDASNDVHNNLWAAWPQWSPDGKSLLFASDRQKLGLGPEAETRPVDLAIWEMPASGGRPTQVSFPPESVSFQPGVGGAGGDTDPQWRPGRSQILFVRWAYSAASTSPVSQLDLEDLTTHTVTPLTDGKERVLQPAFDRSGNSIVYIQGSSGSAGPSRLVVAHLARGASADSLTAQTLVAQGQIAQPAFSPDGRWISYLQADGDGFSLYMVPATGGTPTRIGEAGVDIDSLSRPTWAP
jgi:LCP family protein required for cell wall assembly